jgi:hypothetical protein
MIDHPTHSMSRLFKNANASEWAKLLGPFVVSLFIGFACILIGIYNGIEFVKALGDAFAIAGIIGVCLEIFAANRIIEHASQSVAEKMSGYGLPEPARDRIYDLVHNTKRVYRDHRQTYFIERHPNKPGYVIVRGTISYRVVNNGRGKDDYRPKLEEHESDHPKFESLEFGDETFTTETIRTSTIKTIVAWWPEKTFQLAGSKANTPAELLRPDQQCYVRWTYVREMPEQYSDVIAYTGMTIYPMIELSAKPDGFDFWASDDNSCKHVGNTWKYEQAFVSGQHLRVFWRPKPKNATYDDPPPATASPRMSLSRGEKACRGGGF